MELFCPLCFHKVEVANELAGKIVPCPLCGKQFTAPALATATFSMEPIPSPPPPPPTPAPSPVSTSSASMSTPPPASTAASSPPPKAVTPPKPLPPVQPLAHRFSFALPREALVWIPAGCLVLLFVLSFFSWHSSAQVEPANLWELAFTEKGSGYFYTIYVLITFFLVLPYAVALIVLDQKLVPLPAALEPLFPWRGVPLAALLAILFLPFFWAYFDYTFYLSRPFENPMTFVMRLAFRAHVVALVAAILEVWLYYRRTQGQGCPEFEVRW